MMPVPFGITAILTSTLTAATTDADDGNNNNNNPLTVEQQLFTIKRNNVVGYVSNNH